MSRSNEYSRGRDRSPERRRDSPDRYRGRRDNSLSRRDRRSPEPRRRSPDRRRSPERSYRRSPDRRRSPERRRRDSRSRSRSPRRDNKRRHSPERRERRDGRDERDSRDGRSEKRSPSPIKRTPSPEKKRPKRPTPSPPRTDLRDIYIYTMISAIGAGVFGCVFLAKDPDGNKVAIKRIRLSHPSHYDPQYKREIEVLQMCAHKNVVRLIEVVQSKKFEKYLVLEHCHTDFKVVTGRNAGIAQLKNVMLQLLDGLEYIHSKNIIHRDLKPDNLLFSEDGVLKIADFGSSRIWIEGAEYSPGMVTLRYRAPEIFLGERKYTTAIDIWSAACIFSELFLGKALLDGISALEQVDRMCSVLGTPTEEDWPGFKDLENAKDLVFPKQSKNLLRKFIPDLTDGNFALLTGMFVFNPANRFTAVQAKGHSYWQEEPLPDEHLLLDW